MPVEWKTLGHARIAVADCLDAMASLEAGSIDTILGDAPYCSGGYTEAERTSVKAQGVRGDRWFNGDNMTTMGLVSGVSQHAISRGRATDSDWEQAREALAQARPVQTKAVAARTLASSSSLRYHSPPFGHAGNRPGRDADQ